jgi:YggT family protein
MIRLLTFVDYLLTLYVWVIIAAVIFSWLIAFNVINSYHPFVRTLWQALMAVTEPLLRPIRQFMPDLGGLDISPIILFLAIQLMQWWLIPELKDLVAAI